MELDWLITKLKKYEIASADGTAIAAASALKDFAMKAKAKNPKNFIDLLNETTRGLREARQSSAALQNCLDVIEKTAQDAFIEKVALKELRQRIADACDVFVDRIAKAKERIGEIGSKRIRSGDSILTLCRSTTVLTILKEVAAQGKEIQVFVAESRPDLEGRLMAAEVAALGIPVTLITDFATRIFLPDIDLMLAGGEAITANGAVVSKVGTATLAELCHEARVRVLLALGSYKFSPETMVGRLITLEEGNPNQVIPEKDVSPNVTVRNPLFDITGPDHIDVLITELGIIPPQGAYILLKTK
ncbi:MAG: translation initiation factor eIF-2B [Promethearchaeota archaeon]